MAWDPERYREKRERVLGIKKRGLSFGGVAALVSVALLAGFAFVSVPNAVSYFQTRHLDDAIYRLDSAGSWPETVISGMKSLPGVAGIENDAARLAVTFDRRHAGPALFERVFLEHGLSPALLNRVNHRQHRRAMAAEKEAERETP